MPGLSTKAIRAFEVRNKRCREHPHGLEQKPGRCALAAFGFDPPEIVGLAVARRLHTRIESDVATEVELIGHVVEVAEGFGLGSEVLAPLPLVEEFLGEGVAVAVALRIEASAWVAVPVPSTANPTASLEAASGEAEFAEPVDEVEPGDAGPDDNGIEVRLGLAGSGHRESFLNSRGIVAAT